MTKNDTKMETRGKPLVSAQELEALIEGWGTSKTRRVDRYYPLRSWFLILVVSIHGLWLLFFPERVASLLAIDPSIIEHLTGYLYFRGWYMLIILGFILTYVRGWYVGIVFSALALLGVVNLMLDLFSLYPYRLSHPTAQFTVLMAIRLLGLACVFLNARNAGRLPERKDRLNLFLFRRSPTDA